MLAAALLMQGCLVADGRRAVTAVPSEPMTWLIFVDDLHLHFRDTGRIRKLLHALAAGLIAGRDVFAVKSTGPSSLKLSLTSNRDNLAAAIDRVSGNGLKYSEIVATPPRSQADSEMDYRFRISVSTAVRMLNDLPSWPGRRRAMLYVSGGYDVAKGQERVAEISRAAQRSNVTVFAIDPGALPDAVERPEFATHDDGTRYQAERKKTLARLATRAGGFADVDNLDVAGVTARISKAVNR